MEKGMFQMNLFKIIILIIIVISQCVPFRKTKTHLVYAMNVTNHHMVALMSHFSI